MAVVGGTASVLGGGKFASGAMAGAFMQMINAEIGRYFVSKPEAHNGGKTHVHWGSSANKRFNAINTDGTVRHGKYPPNKVKNFINKMYKNFKLPSIPIIVPTQVYEYYLAPIYMTDKELSQRTFL